MDEEGNWSAQFVRLRTETTVVAFLIFAIVLLGMKINRIPFIGADYQPTGHMGAILIILYILFIYLFVSWGVRFKVETDSRGISLPQFEAFLDELKEVVHAIHSKEPPNLTPGDYVRESVRDMMDRINTKTEDAWTVVSRMAETPVDADSGPNVRRANSAAIQRTYAENLKQTIDDALSSLFNALQKDETERVRHHAAMEGYGASVREEYKRSFDKLTELNAAVEQLARKIGSFRSWHNWDKLILGFWAPFLACGLLVSVSSFQGRIDMAPAFKRLLSCGDGSCLYRTSGRMPPGTSYGRPAAPGGKFEHMIIFVRSRE